MRKTSDGEGKKLVLSKTTLKNLSVKTGIRTGLSGTGCVQPTDNCGDGGGGGGGGTGDCGPSCKCRGYPFTSYA